MTVTPPSHRGKVPVFAGRSPEAEAIGRCYPLTAAMPDPAKERIYSHSLTVAGVNTSRTGHYRAEKKGSPGHSVPHTLDRCVW